MALDLWKKLPSCFLYVHWGLWTDADDDDKQYIHVPKYIVGKDSLTYGNESIWLCAIAEWWGHMVSVVASNLLRTILYSSLSRKLTPLAVGFGWSSMPWENPELWKITLVGNNTKHNTFLALKQRNGKIYVYIELKWVKWYMNERQTDNLSTSTIYVYVWTKRR